MYETTTVDCQQKRHWRPVQIIHIFRTSERPLSAILPASLINFNLGVALQSLFYIESRADYKSIQQDSYYELFKSRARQRCETVTVCSACAVTVSVSLIMD